MSGATIALLLISGTLWTPGTGYLMQKISLCSYGDNKQGNITFATGFTLNRQVVLAYSAENEMFLPCRYCIPDMKAVARRFAFLLNTDPNTVTRVKKEEEVCKEQVRTFWNKTVERTVKPSVEVFLPVQLRPESLPVLVCHVWGFYPKEIRVAWFKNNKLVKNYTEAARAGDWTYSLVVTLDMRDSLPGDNYTCMVDHVSLGNQPIAKDWRPGMTVFRIAKISVAAVVFALGLVCIIAAVFCQCNHKRSGYSPIPGYNEDN